MKPPKKNPSAQALAKLSRLNPTEAQKAASRANGLLGAAHGKKGGRPKKPLRVRLDHAPADSGETAQQSPESARPEKSRRAFLCLIAPVNS